MLLSLVGVYIIRREGVVPKALEHFPETYPEVKTIHLHLDNDEVGRGAAQGIMKGLEGLCQVWNQPPPKGKDVNDYLQKLIETYSRTKGIKPLDKHTQ